MNPTTNYDVIITGAGPSDIFCVHELIQKEPGMKILMMEKGHSIEKRVCPKRTIRVCAGCKPHSIATGFAGAGALSGGRLSLSLNVGGNLPEIPGYDRTVRLLKESDNIYLKFGTDTDVYGVDKQKEIEKIRRKAIGANLKLTEYPIRHLGTEEGYKIYTRFQEYLLTQGITMGFNAMVRDIIIEGDIAKGIITDKGETYYAPGMVSAIGREGSDWSSHTCGSHGIQTQAGTVDIDIHVRVRGEVMRFLSEDLHEAKPVYYTPTFGSKVRTLCTNPSGEIATEYHENGFVMVNGHAHKSQEYKTSNTNFALLVNKNLTRPLNEPIGYGKHTAQLPDMLCGGRTMVQTFGNSQRERRTTEERPCRDNLIPTLKDAVPGDLSLVFPHHITTDIKEMSLVLDKVTLGIADDETLFYDVGVKFCSNEVVVNAGFETSIRGPRAIGDDAPVARGLQQASANGISVAKSALKQMETL